MATHAALTACQDLARYARANDLTEADEVLMEIMALMACTSERRKRSLIRGQVQAMKVIWSIRQTAPGFSSRRPVRFRGAAPNSCSLA